MVMDNITMVPAMQPSTSWENNTGELVQIDGLEFNEAKTMDECITALEQSFLPTYLNSSTN